MVKKVGEKKRNSRKHKEVPREKRRNQHPFLKKQNKRKFSLCPLHSHLFLIYMKGGKERKSRQGKEEERVGVWTALKPSTQGARGTCSHHCRSPGGWLPGRSAHLVLVLTLLERRPGFLCSKAGHTVSALWETAVFQ